MLLLWSWGPAQWPTSLKMTLCFTNRSLGYRAAASRLLGFPLLGCRLWLMNWGESSWDTSILSLPCLCTFCPVSMSYVEEELPRLHFSCFRFSLCNIELVAGPSNRGTTAFDWELMEKGALYSWLHFCRMELPLCWVKARKEWVSHSLNATDCHCSYQADFLKQMLLPFLCVHSEI